jgi:transcriptional regulator with XRE-family HTH domain
MSTSSLCLKFGKKLSSLRAQKGITQEDLAEAAGLSVDFLSLIERGRRAPSFKTLEQLSSALSINVKDLFDFVEE